MGRRARGWSLLLVGTLTACGERSIWISLPPAFDGTELLILGGVEPRGYVEPTLPFSVEVDPEATLELLQFDETREGLGLGAPVVSPRTTPPGVGESPCVSLAEHRWRASPTNPEIGWSEVTDAASGAEAFVCARPVRPDEQCLDLLDGERLVISTATSSPGVFAPIDGDHVLYTLIDHRAFVVDRSGATPVPELQAFMDAEGYALSAAWRAPSGEYWAGGTLGALARITFDGARFSATTIIPPFLPEEGPLPDDLFQLTERISAIGGRAVAGDVELYAVTTRQRFLHRAPNQGAWTVVEPTPRPTSSYPTMSVAVLDSGEAAAALVRGPGITRYLPGATPPVSRLRDPLPSMDRAADVVLSDGDGFLVAFPSPDLFLLPPELYRLKDGRFSTYGFLPASDDDVLTAVRLDDTLLFALTNGNFTLHPTAVDCEYQRVSEDGPAAMLLVAPDEVVFAERIQDRTEVTVYWQRFSRFR